MPQTSAGILLFRKNPELEFFLVHPGGPFFKNKDYGFWTIPKGLIEENEDPLSAAKREFKEETGYHLEGSFIQLHGVTQKSGKRVVAWAVEGDINETKIVSNTFIMEWPPRSGRQQEFPEVDRGAWFNEEEALLRINEAQGSFIKQLTSEEL